jgi:hypothetical protein
VIIDGVDSGAICGQCSWDVPNNAISGPVHSCAECERMRKARSCLSRRKGGERTVSSLLREPHSERRYPGFAEAIVARISFPRNGLGTVQESHRSECDRKCDYPADTDSNVTP